MQEEFFHAAGDVALSGEPADDLKGIKDAIAADSLFHISGGSETTLSRRTAS